MLTLALAACAPAPMDEGGATGVRGRVVLFPSTPVETGASPARPKGVATTVLFESDDGIRRVETASDGTFKKELPPGRYLVTPRQPPGSTYVPVSQAVTVGSGFVRVTLVLETRLREP